MLQSRRALQFHDQRVERLLPERPVGTGQIDQIRAVGDQVAETGLGHRRAQLVHVVIGQFRCGPAVVVLDEHLNTLAADFLATLHGLVETAGHGHVSAKYRLRFIHGPGRSIKPVRRHTSAP